MADPALTDWPFHPARSPRIVGGDGAWLIADDGRRILDAAGGAIVTNVGHGRAEVLDAVRAAGASGAFVVPIWRTPEREALAERLRRDWLPEGLSHIHLASGGSEGVEAAVKIAVQHHAATGQKRRTKVMARELSYHGTTIAMAGLSGHAARKRGLEGMLADYPVVPTPWPLRSRLGPHHPGCGADYLAATRAAIEAQDPSTVAALVVEPVTGSSGGAIVPPPDYLPGVRAMCDEYGILLIIDEVMTGFGRTGRKFGVEHWDVSPDILVSGKGLGGGYAAICGVFATSAVAEPIAEAGLQVMFHTFAGLPSACAAADAVLAILTRENLVERAAIMGARLGDQLRAKLGQHPNVAEVRGLGLLQAVELVRDRDSLEPFDEADNITGRVVGKGLSHGAFFYPGGTGVVRDIVCLGPALTSSEGEIDLMADILTRAIGDVLGVTGSGSAGVAVALGLMATTGASAAIPAEGSAHALALAAGYKAAFLCSGVFNAGETVEAIAGDDLQGVYPQYQRAVERLPAIIDAPRHTVSVTFDQALPPRVATWRPWLGCALLPIGADPAAAALLPRLEGRFAPDDDALPWPQGEAGLGAPPDGQRKGPVSSGRAALEAAVTRAFDHSTYGAGTETTAVVVADARQVLAEHDRPGWDPDRPQRTWSAAKSLTATLIGRAVQEGLLKVDAPADIPEWRAPGDPRAAITMAELMHMASGLWTDGPGNRTDEVYLGGAAVNEAATAMPLEAAPGTRFRYANNDALLAARALRARLGDGDDALAFPFTQLLWPMGMTRTTPETDWRGNFVLSSQVWSTARDLARLGLLYLADGMWNGKRLLPEGWARFVATPAPAQPETAAPPVSAPARVFGPAPEPAKPPGPGYGAFFWLYGPAQGLPAGTYAMEGNRGQYVFIVPARGVVIVRRGFDSSAGGAQFDMARFARDVLAAMPSPKRPPSAP